MAAAIETLVSMHGGRRTIAVLGDMLELGAQSTALHREIGRVAGDAHIDQLYVAGNFATAVADGAMDRQMKADRIFCGTKEAIIEQLNHHLQEGDMILVKGSRGMAMEQVVEAIVGWADER
jgi:UDP-N-acetylmuramoyl-tripeptide--D-alanyl-D-alanine ligase